MALETKYNMVVEERDFDIYCIGLKNRIYKLLPLREEELEWQKYLNTTLVEVSGSSKQFNSHDVLLRVLGKLEGLYDIDRLAEQHGLKAFELYRDTIFECLGLIETIGCER